ncbi:hypothetical protein, partial [Chlorobium phaeovibrioides]|uniref:hypothetical protein n=1 Tax=Chlorobium phaeovibrioides TaxID=1094 RepID=UPI001C8BC495
KALVGLLCKRENFVFDGFNIGCPLVSTSPSFVFLVFLGLGLKSHVFIVCLPGGFCCLRVGVYGFGAYQNDANV